jgi:hypothetical protein
MAGKNLSPGGTPRQTHVDRGSRDVAKWTRRKTMLFIAGASLALWLIILILAIALLR